MLENDLCCQVNQTDFKSMTHNAYKRNGSEGVGGGKRCHFDPEMQMIVNDEIQKKLCHCTFISTVANNEPFSIPLSLCLPGIIHSSVDKALKLHERYFNFLTGR